MMQLLPSCHQTTSAMLVILWFGVSWQEMGLSVTLIVL